MAEMAQLVARQNFGPLGDMPAAPPPPGVVPNLVDPPSVAFRLYICIAIFGILAMASYGIRIFTRIRILHSFGPDDIMLSFAMFFGVAFGVNVIVHTFYGLGVHIWNVKLKTLSPSFLILTYTSSLLYILAIITLRLSVLMLYYRLSPAKVFRWTVIALFVINAVHGFIGFFIVVGTCRPVNKYWDLTITGGSCVNRNMFSISAGYTNIIYDFILVILPLSTVWKLHLPVRQKIAVSAIFMVGLIIVAVGIVRLIQLIPILKSPDTTYNLLGAQLWSLIEVYVGIICISFATFKPFVWTYCPWLIGAVSRNRSNQQGSGGVSGSHQKWSRKAAGDSDGSGVQRSHGSHTMPWSKKKKGDMESFDLDDRAQTTVSGQPPARDVSSFASDVTPRGSTDHIIRNGNGNAAHDYNGIVKTTHVLVRDEEKGGKMPEKIRGHYPS